MTQKHENLITWIMMTTGFLGIIWWGSVSLEFQRACETRCGHTNAITPLMGFREECFCEDFHGKWRRVDVKDVTGETQGG